LNDQLIVISLLDGKGPTGVEAHFNQLIDEARAHGIDSLLVSAYPSRRLWAKLARLLIPAVRLVDQEGAGVLSLWINSQLIAGKLASVMMSALAPVPARAGDDNGTVTLYAQDPVSARVALKAANGRRTCRVVTVIHYNSSQGDELVMKGEARRGGPLWRFIVAAEAQALPRVDHLIFVSKFMQGEIGARMPAIGAVPQSVIPNFIGAVVGSSLPVGGDGNPGGRDLIAIGTLEARKNQAFLLHVLARARSRGHIYTLTLVGDGPDHASLVALAAQLGLRDQVSFAGFQKHAARLIPRHRVLVHAALIENMPITLIEALAMGRPILAPAVGGIPEIFSDGVEGYFWPLDDIDAAAGLLIKVLGDAGAWGRLSQAALARYGQKFHRDLLVGQWLAAIMPPRQDAAAVAATLAPAQALP
jgi:glycosyltransferase involved in cell wall biosynthesis